MPILLSVIILLAAAIFIVMILKKLKLSPVLGYLISGALIGNHGFKIVTFEQTHMIAELGIIFLLFAIGLKLSFSRLNAMKKYVFGLGSLQIIITTVIIGIIVLFFIADKKAAVIIGGGLALSSTAIVLQVLEEMTSSSKQLGRVSLAILIQQDFIVVPLLVVVPLLKAGSSASITYAIMIAFSKAIIVLIGIFVVGRLFLHPLFSLISDENIASTNELFFATTLLIVLAAAWSTEYFGLSSALGAFVAGILVAETNFKSQVEESIYLFKGLLLGLFFMTVGMKIDVFKIYKDLWVIACCSLGLIVVKSLIITSLCLFFQFSKSVSIQAGLLMSQGSEFTFILFDLATSNNIISHNVSSILLFTITISMALTPLIVIIGRKISCIIDRDELNKPLENLKRAATDLKNHIIIAGFNKTGQIIAKVLELAEKNYIAIDINEKMHDKNKDKYAICYGDITQLSTLNALGLSRATAIVVTIDNSITLRKTIKIISARFPNLTIIIRTYTLANVAEFYELGATIVVPTECEAGLQIASSVLKVTSTNASQIARIKTELRNDNYQV